MKASRGKSIFAAFLLTSGVQRRLSHLYMDDLSEKLKECKTGNCGVGLTIWWCLLITLLKVMVCNMTLNLTFRRVLSILLKNQGGSKGKLSFILCGRCCEQSQIFGSYHSGWAAVCDDDNAANCVHKPICRHANSRCVQMRLKQPFSTVYCIRLYTPNSNIKMHPESRSSSQDGRVQAPLWQVTSPPLMPCWRNSCKFMCWLIDWKRNNGLNWANIKRHKAIIVLYCCVRF